jgi:hypothetical protein
MYKISKDPKFRINIKCILYAGIGVLKYSFISKSTKEQPVWENIEVI